MQKPSMHVSKWQPPSPTLCAYSTPKLPTGKAPRPGRNVYEALGDLQKCILYVSLLNFRSLTQMRILIEYKIPMHLPTEHTRCNDNIATAKGKHNTTVYSD